MSIEINTSNGDRVPFVQKLAFGLGHFVNNLLPGALGIFMFFLLTAFGMDPFLAGLLGGLPRLFDAITDPIMGFISDNTKSRWGRRRPYIFIGAIMSGLLYMLLWNMDEANGSTYNFWYFLIFSLLYLVGNTTFSTPLIGLGYEMTSDYNERTRLMAFSQTLGQVAWMIVPWFWVLIADPDLFDSQAEGVRTLAVFVGMACIAFGILPGIFCREIKQDHLENQADLTIANIAKNFKQLLVSFVQVSKNLPFMRLCGATFLVFNGFQMVASFSYFIIVFYMFDGSYEDTWHWPAWFATVSAVITAFMVIPVITYMSNQFGKRRAFLYSTGISIIGYLLKWWSFDPNNPWLLFMPLPFMAFGLGGLFTLMMSMTADVCDLDELENGMPRKEGQFGAIYWWMVKLGQGVALVLGGAVLKYVGFDQDLAQQSADTMFQLRIFDIAIPAITAALAMWIMWNYSLNEKRVRSIKEILIKRRGKLF